MGYLVHLPIHHKPVTALHIIKRTVPEPKYGVLLEIHCPKMHDIGDLDPTVHVAIPKYGFGQKNVSMFPTRSLLFLQTNLEFDLSQMLGREFVKLGNHSLRYKPVIKTTQQSIAAIHQYPELTNSNMQFCYAIGTVVLMHSTDWHLPYSFYLAVCAVSQKLQELIAGHVDRNEFSLQTQCTPPDIDSVKHALQYFDEFDPIFRLKLKSLPRTKPTGYPQNVTT